MEALENSSAREDERTLYLLRVAQAERRQNVTFPLARITTCGTLTIEVLRAIHVGEGDHLEAIYGLPDAKILVKKGTSQEHPFLSNTLPSTRTKHTPQNDFLAMVMLLKHPFPNFGMSLTYGILSLLDAKNS